MRSQTRQNVNRVSAGDWALQLNLFENVKMWILLYNGSRRSRRYGPKEASPKPTAGSDFSPSTPPRTRKKKVERQTDGEGETFNAHLTLSLNKQPYQNNSIIPSSLGPHTDLSSHGTWDADHSRSPLSRSHLTCPRPPKNPLILSLSFRPLGSC